MAREVRIEYAGAIYHVMARGNAGAPVYLDDRDREFFLRTLGEACDKTGWCIHAYVLMPNHYHLLLETPEPNLVAGMKWLQGTFTRRHHVRHGLSGHLFQGRYRAIAVEVGAHNYFGVVSTYIHLNPVRAGLVRAGKESLSSYRWSSYPFYVEVFERHPPWLRKDQVMRELGFSPKDPEGLSGYKTYLEGRVLEWGIVQGRQRLEEQWRELRRGWYLGSEGFRNRLLGEVGRVQENHHRASYTGGAKAAHDERMAELLLIDGMERLRVDASRMQSLPKGALEKRVLAWWLRQKTTISRRWIKDKLGMGDESRVTQAVRTVTTAQQGDLQRMKDLLTREAAIENVELTEKTLWSTPEFLD
jgi:putative transposase